MKLKPNEFRCAVCKQVFQKETPDKEAEEEAFREFGVIPKEDRAVVCDDCYQSVRPDRNPVAYAKYLEWVEERNKKS